MTEGDADGLLAGVAHDVVKSALARMAIDVYDVLLTPREMDWHAALFRHPVCTDLQSAIEADQDLQLLFPDEEPRLGRAGMLYATTDQSRSGILAQSSAFDPLLIGAAWRAACMRTRVPTVEQLVETVHRHVDIMRDAAAGKPTQRRCLVAFTGFATGGEMVPTPWGPLRPLTDEERNLAPPELEGVVSHTDAEGSTSALLAPARWCW